MAVDRFTAVQAEAPTLKFIGVRLAFCADGVTFDSLNNSETVRCATIAAGYRAGTPLRAGLTLFPKTVLRIVVVLSWGNTIEAETIEVRIVRIIVGRIAHALPK